MRDGYYLCLYLVCDDLTCDNQISLRHDQNISLWRKRNCDIELVHYWELERVTRRKQHYHAMRNSENVKQLINDLLLEYEITMDDCVEIIGTPPLSTINDLEIFSKYPDFALHTIFHLFSAALMDTDKFFNDKIIAFSVDAGPDTVIEWTGKNCNNYYYYAGCIVDHGKIEVFPVKSSGILWMLAVIKFNSREGTLMALASASRSKLNEQVVEIPNLENPNDMKCVNEYLNTIIEIVQDISDEDVGTKVNEFDKRFSVEDNKLSMIMKIIQKQSIEIMHENVQSVINTYKIDSKEYYLAIGGGYALNCPTNSYLLDTFEFKGFLAPPCVNDSGQSLGIGLSYFYYTLNKFNYKFSSPYLGNEEVFLKDEVMSKYGSYIKKISDFQVEKVVSDIRQEPIVWFYGKSEIGPRALGHRSILGNPGDIKTKDKINKMKQRQWWRPVAPVILEEEWNEWFSGHMASPYMLCTNTIKEDKREKVQAIIHLDNTARLQTVNQKDEPLLYDILVEMKKQTSIPILCNTSLNDAGEPIIDSVDELFNFALRKKISVLYFNGYRIELQNYDNYSYDAPFPCVEKIDQLFTLGDEEMRGENNPYHISKEILTYYLSRPSLNYLNIKEKEDVKKLVSFYEEENRNSPALQDIYRIHDK